MDWEILQLKLITGETIISHVKYDKLKKNAVLKNPLAFSYLNKSNGTSSLLATKWMETDKRVFTIKTYHIIATVDPSQLLHRLYLESVEEMEELSLEPVEDSDTTSDTKWDDLVDYMDTLIEEDNTLH